jgi:acyl transferase domain-containing protein
MREELQGKRAPAEAHSSTIRAAYVNARISNISVTAYVEYHGTGTQAGDRIEVNGVASLFSPHHSPERPLVIGSVSYATYLCICKLGVS